MDIGAEERKSSLEKFAKRSKGKKPAKKKPRALKPNPLRKRTGAKSGLRPSADIVPPQAVAGRALTLVVAIMSFLACLTVGAVSVVHDAADAWSNDLVRELTIQIRPIDGVDTLREIDRIIALVQEFPGIGSVRALSDQETQNLLEPWLGEGLQLDALPVPRLIQVDVSDPEQLDLDALRHAIQRDSSGVSLDDHSAWTGQLAAMAGAVVFGGFAILALVLGSMVLSVVFATRAAMAGNKDVVEVLHFVGAEDSFVAREFERHFLVLGLKGGFVGGVVACMVFVLLGLVTQKTTGFAGTEQVSVLFGGVSVSLMGYLGVLTVVVLVAILTAITSRLAVHAHLARMD